MARLDYNIEGSHGWSHRPRTAFRTFAYDETNCVRLAMRQAVIAPSIVIAAPLIKPAAGPAR